MKIAIDATNIKAGGGLTHLKRIIESVYLKDDVITLIGGSWLNEIGNRDNLNKIILEKEFSSLWRQEFFKFFKLKRYFANTDIVFAPGGTLSINYLPYVSMSQNMLVFESIERNRFPKSFTWLRYLVLERLQVRSFKRSNGIIYISEYAKNYIETKFPFLKEKKSTVIYHGISDDFRQAPKQQKAIESFNFSEPFKILYVSIVNYYKHQGIVIEAVKRLRAKGYPIRLELIGSLNQQLKTDFEKSLIGTDEFVTYKGKVPYLEIANSYKAADLFIFASTCENMPNILVEAMSAGLPVLCSNFGPMPEILKDSGRYMNPLDVESVTENLERLLNSPQLRQELAQKAYERSKAFTWEKTADETFQFLKLAKLESTK